MTQSKFLLVITYSIITFLIDASVNGNAQEINRTKISYESKEEGVVANLLHEKNDSVLLFPYEKNFLLYTLTNNINKNAIQKYDWADKARKDELLFQFSFAFPIWKRIISNNSILSASYTQRSWWQILNIQESSPFRETNYEPQIFLGWSTDYELANWILSDIQLGINHQSNGRSHITSRSWNRVFLRLMVEKEKWQIDFMPWLQIGETEDNLDIIEYMGYYRLRTTYKWGKSTISAEGQYNWNSGYGGINIGWSTSISPNLDFYIQIFNGYGESLIDYNYRQTRGGIGFILNL